jgi:hypothetical protein
MLEVLIIIGILVSVFFMLVPAIQNSRENARRMQCVHNMMRLGQAMHNYHDAHKHFPPSSGVSRDADGKITAVDGWSWQAMLLPFLGEKALYDRLDTANGRPLAEPDGAQRSPHADALATSLPFLLCPSYGGSPYADPAPRTAAITNYKAMGATHIESLSVASPHPLTPKYNPEGKKRDGDTSSVPYHPDGGWFPGTGLTGKDFPDGTAHTIVAAESVEQQFARWTVGAEATVVALPRNVEFERPLQTYFAPKGLSKAQAAAKDWAADPDREDRSWAWDLSTVDPVYWTHRTYMDCDCDANPYDGADGRKGGRYGPSSHHPEIVNHLMCDGSVRSVRREMDVAYYMYQVTRAGVGEPSGW